MRYDMRARRAAILPPLAPRLAAPRFATRACVHNPCGSLPLALVARCHTCPSACARCVRSLGAVRAENKLRTAIWCAALVPAAERAERDAIHRGGRAARAPLDSIALLPLPLSGVNCSTSSSCVRAVWEKRVQESVALVAGDPPVVQQFLSNTQQFFKHCVYVGRKHKHEHEH